MRWMLSCKDVSQLLSESMDRTLPFYQRMLMRLHLLMCKYCARLTEHFKALRVAGRHEELYGNELDESRALSRAGKERLKEFLKNHLSRTS